jgi:hypothetical protein
MKNKGLWLVAGAVAAIAAYEVFFADAHIPAGYEGINVAAGEMNLAAAPGSGNVAGQFAFILPKGAKWDVAARNPTPASPQVAVPLPSTTTAPLLVTNVTPGQAFMFSWTDASGTGQASVYIFA